MDKNLYPSSDEIYRKIIDAQPDEIRREFKLYGIRKAVDKVVSLFLPPANSKGRVTLRRGGNM